MPLMTKAGKSHRAIDVDEISKVKRQPTKRVNKAEIRNPMDATKVGAKVPGHNKSKSHLPGKIKTDKDGNAPSSIVVPDIAGEPCEIDILWSTVRPVFTKEALTHENVSEAIERCHGILGFAARMLGIKRDTLARYISDKPDLKALLTDERENLIDMAEAKTYVAMSRGEPWALALVLQTIGRERGWGPEFVQKSKKGQLLELLDKMAIEAGDYNADES